MDGFAVRMADLAVLPTRLRMVGEVAAGSGATPGVVPGTCVRIFTGANVPDDADTVVKVEDTRVLNDDTIEVRSTDEHANIFKRGENAKQGDVLVARGQTLGAMHIAACAAAGRAHLRVRRRPRVAIITTGRELLEPGTKTALHQERDSDGPMLKAALETAGFVVSSAHRVSDDATLIGNVLRDCLAQNDAIVLSGGVSMGNYDFVPAVVRNLNAKVLVHGVAMKPGKPFLFALAAGGACIFGLPGNPLSAATGLHEFVLPALRTMAGQAPLESRPLLHAKLRATIRTNPGREQFVLASLTWTEAGAEVEALGTHSSADLAAGARADGAIIVPAEVEGLAAGTRVAFRPWRSWP